MTKKNGYTLVEVMVSLLIFMAFALPLIHMIGSITTDFRGREYVTAASLLDRTYEKIKLCPESLRRVERFQVGGQEWRVEITTRGEEPTQFVVTVYKGEVKIETAQFYR